jgi:hypothetical protein
MQAWKVYVSRRRALGQRHMFVPDLTVGGAHLGMGMPLIYFAIVGFVIAFPQGLLARILSRLALVYLGSISCAD